MTKGIIELFMEMIIEKDKHIEKESATCNKTERSILIDILKGIGIISVIVGHVAGVVPLVSMFVYTYNIMVFCFAVGMGYLEEKYASKPQLYIGRRVFAVLKYFVFYNTIFVLLHNILIRYSLIRAVPYNFGKILIWISCGFVLTTSEDMLGGFWFLQFYVITCILISFCMYVGYKIGSQNTKIKKGIQIVLVILCGMTGLYFSMRELTLSYHLQTALLAVPVFYVGSLCNKKIYKLGIGVCRVGYLICAGILIYLIKKFQIRIELTSNNIDGYYSFYLITAIGICFCLCLGRCLENNKWLSKVFAFIGKNSLHYMALHFFMFKIFDFFATKWCGDSFETRMKFPVSYVDLWYIYIVASIAMITALLLAFQKKNNKE